MDYSDKSLAKVIQFPGTETVIPQSIEQSKIEVVHPKQKRKPRAKTKVEYQYNIQPSKFKSIFHKFLNLNSKDAKSGKYFIEGNQLIHRTYFNYGRDEQIEIIAKRIGKLVIGNSSTLRTIGVTVRHGNIQHNSNETEVQQELAKIIPMIPFSVFVEAKLNLDKIKILNKGPQSIVTITRMKTRAEWEKDTTQKNTITEDRHFTGASLFSIEGKTFLFDIDRREIEHEIFNPFLVRLPRPCKSIEAAYEMLKPKAVKAALAKGLEVERQGEWFFIPVTDKKLINKLNKLSSNGRKLSEFELQAGPNRPNDAKGVRIDSKSKRFTDLKWDSQHHNWQNFDKRNKTHIKAAGEIRTYCRGNIEHRGREHKTLKLKHWCVPIPNTGTFSWQISGQVD